MDEKSAEGLNTSLAANRILSNGAGRLSASLDSFSGWLLAGFGAAYGLLLANLGSLAPYIRISNVKYGAIFFLVAASLAAAQKLIAAYVVTGAAAGEDGREMGKELANSRAPLNIEGMYQQVNQGLFWPWSVFNACMTAKAKRGDYAAIGRFHAKASQIQTYMVAFQSIVSLVSAGILVGGITI